MSLSHSPKITTDGLLISLDPMDPKSYSGSGVDLYDRFGNVTAEAKGYTDGAFDYPTFNGKSFSFDGVSQRFHISHILGNNELAYTADGSLGSDTYTWELWVRTDDADTGYIYSKPWTNSAYNYRITHNTFDVRSGSEFPISLTFDSITDGEWHHLVCSVDPSNLKVTIDGGQYTNERTNTMIGGEFSGNLQHKSVLMGIYPYGDTYSGNTTLHVPGNLGLFRVYNRTLTSDEILQNYNALKERYRL